MKPASNAVQIPMYRVFFDKENQMQMTDAERGEGYCLECGDSKHLMRLTKGQETRIVCGICLQRYSIEVKYSSWTWSRYQKK